MTALMTSTMGTIFIDSLDIDCISLHCRLFANWITACRNADYKLGLTDFGGLACSVNQNTIQKCLELDCCLSKAVTFMILMYISYSNRLNLQNQGLIG